MTPIWVVVQRMVCIMSSVQIIRYSNTNGQSEHRIYLNYALKKQT